MKKIIILLVLTAPFIAFSIESKKIYISNLYQLSGDTNYAFYQSALSKSITGTLKQNNVAIIYHEKIKKTSDLISEGYEYLIRGSYSVKHGELSVNFSVVHLKKFRPIINATVKGYPDPRVFDLVDKICKSLSETIKKYIPERENRIIEVNISRQGKIQQKNETTDSAVILKKLTGLWKLKDTGTFYKQLFINPPGRLRINSDGSWYFWFTATQSYSTQVLSYSAGRLGFKGKKLEIIIPAFNGGIASLRFTEATHYLAHKTFNWVPHNDLKGRKASLLFRSENFIECALITDIHDYPEAGSDYISMLWERVR